VSDAELSSARQFYARGELERIGHGLTTLVTPRANPNENDRRAEALLARTKLVGALMKAVKVSLLATAEGVERIELTGGGHVTGVELPDGRVVSFGAETTVRDDDVVSRTKLSKPEYESAARERLQKQVDRVKPDDALGHFRCAYYAWTYGLRADAMPHVDAAIDSDDFPLIARVFHRESSRALLAHWSSVTGRSVKRTGPPPLPPTPSPTPADSPAPSPSPSPVVTEAAPVEPDEPAPVAELAKVRELFQQGTARYRDSFGESKDPDKALALAKKLLEQARDELDRAPASPEAEQLRVDVQSLLFDVRKRTRI
jgi:hypothetical protein